MLAGYADLLGTPPAWLVITPLIGVVTGSLFFLVAGRRPASLFLYVVLAVITASAVQAAGIFQTGGPPFSLGDVNLLAPLIASWLALVMTRAADL